MMARAGGGKSKRAALTPLIPAKAGTQTYHASSEKNWILAFAGMSGEV